MGSDDRAEPGEASEPTVLYDPFKTKSKAFNEWGIGMDLYFMTLRMVSAMLLVGGLLNIPNIMFYASPTYSTNGQESISSIFLKGSALCTTREWVVCRDCVVEDFEGEEHWRIGITSDGTVLVQRNDCNGANINQGLVNFATFLVLLGSMMCVSLYLRTREIRADEDKYVEFIGSQRARSFVLSVHPHSNSFHFTSYPTINRCTSTDYSVEVDNPPPNVFDPDVWRSFFEQFGPVTCVTIALDNDELLRKLTKRRVQQQMLRLLLPGKIDMDDSEQLEQALEEWTRQHDNETSAFSKHFVNPLLVAMGLVVLPQSIHSGIERLTEEIRVLQKKEYNACHVFVTFETEVSQRKALTALSVAKLDVWMNNIGHVAPEIVFHDRVLAVEEPVEPDSVRWLDLSSTITGRTSTWLFSLIATLGCLMITGAIVVFTRTRYGPFTAGMVVSVFNSIIPEVVNMLLTQEQHLSTCITTIREEREKFHWCRVA